MTVENKAIWQRGYRDGKSDDGMRPRKWPRFEDSILQRQYALGYQQGRSHPARAYLLMHPTGRRD